MEAVNTSPYPNLFERLRNVGFDTPYVRNTALPTWWQKSAEVDRSVYQECLLWLSRHLGLTMESLLNETAPLKLKDFGSCNFKKTSSVTNAELAVARSIATRAAQIAASSIQDLPTKEVPSTGSGIRESILNSGSPWVDLSSLLDWCWNSGIPVLHISHFPKPVKKMHGMAAIVNGRPVIVLSRNARQEAWLLFILAHEIGHIVNGHVENNGVLVDGKFTDDDSDDNVDAQEIEADGTALEILTGNSKSCFTDSGRWPNASELAKIATEFGSRRQVDPGHVVLNYSKNKGAEFLKLGNAALKIMSPHSNAPKLVFDKMAERLDWSGLSEGSSEFLMRITSPKPAT